MPTAVNAIKGGAVDFIEKPFGYRETLSVDRRKRSERDAELRERQAPARRRSPSAWRRSPSASEGVLQRVIEGKANKVIAAELDISVKTVEVHRAKVMEKMRVGLRGGIGAAHPRVFPNGGTRRAAD